MESRLTAEELDAIQAAISQQARKPASAQAIEASTVALIADDRAAERARPNGLRIANRWAGLVRDRLQRLTGTRIDVDVVGAETVDASSLRDDLAAAWCRCVNASKRPGPALVAVSGPIIETLSAAILGGRVETAGAARPPSRAALRVFDRAGVALIEALATAWHDEQGCDVAAAHDVASADKWRREAGEGDIVVVVTLTTADPIPGTVRLIAPPEMLVVPVVPFDAVPAPAGAIEEALGGVPIEVRVELGRVKLTMSDLARLQPGTLLPLHKFIDDPLPLMCAGKLKAHGKALVTRGVMAVEITEVEA